MTISEPLFIILITSISGIIMKLISMCYKSKCKSIDCFGIHIHRRVELETDNDEENVSEQKKPTSYSL
jgi:hypothetical protein